MGAEMNRWQPKVDALLRLIAADSGATGGERATAKRKLELILKHHPQREEIVHYEPISEFLTTDILWMKRNNIPINGAWTGRTMEEAIGLMVADYQRRLKTAKAPRLGEQ